MTRDRSQPAYAVIGGALSVCHLLNDMVQSLLPAIYPILKAALQLDFRHIGLITLVNQLTASLLQPVIGYYTDRRPKPHRSPSAWDSRWRVCCCWRRPTISAGCSRPPRSIGVGSSIFHPESSRIARLASGGQHGLAQSLFQVGGNAGSAIGPLLAAFVVLPHGQRSLAWFAIVPLVAMVVLWPSVRWYERAPAAADGGDRAAASAVAAQVNRALAALLVLVFSRTSTWRASALSTRST